MKRRALLFTSMTVLLAGGSALVGQSLQTGALAGTVKDSAGKPLAGIHVRAASGQTERSLVTNDRGEYRFPLLNPGPWSLTVHGNGYQPSTAKAYVGINDTQTANFKLAPVGTAVVEVVTTLEAVDVTTTQTSVTLNAESISALPVNLTSVNGLDGIMASLPGVVSYGDNKYYIAGGGHDQNLFTVDGNITNVTRNNQGSTFVSGQPPSEFMENVEVVTGGFGAEYNVLGGAINMVTKTGSNTWAGEIYAYTNFPFAASRGKFNPATTPAPAPGYQVAPGDKFHRFGFDVSGPLIKDKLFFFLGYQGFKDRLPASDSGGANLDGLVSDDRTTDGPNVASLKVNWLISNDHQLVFSATRTKRTDTDGHQYPPSTYWEAGTLDMGARTTYEAQTTNVTWNWTITPELYLVTSAGTFTDPTHTRPNIRPANGVNYSVWDNRYWIDGPGRDAASKPDSAEYWTYLSGTGYMGAADEKNPNRQIRLDLTWTPRNHLIKAGYLRQDTRVESFSEAVDLYVLFNEFTDGTYIGDPTALQRYRSADYRNTLKGELRSYYVKDLWEISPGLRLDLGLRYDPFRFIGGSGVFDGVELGSFNSFKRQLQPRAGLTWDLGNDSRSKLFVHLGRYFETMPLESVSWATVTSSAMEYWLADHYTYNVNYAGSQPAFTLLTNPATGKPYAPDVVFDFGTVGKPSPRATDLKLPHKDMVLLGYDQVLNGGWTVGAAWRYWTMEDVLEDSYFTQEDGSSAFAGMTQKVTWNPRPGPVTFLDSDGESHTWNSPFPDPKDRYISLNFHAQHQGPGHYLALDYTWVHHYGNYRGVGSNAMSYRTGSSVAPGSPNASSEFDFYRTITSGNYENDPVHQVKMRGSFTIPLAGSKLEVGPVFTWQSGLGLSKGVPVGTRFPGYMGRPTDLVQPGDLRCDMGRTPTTAVLDVNLSMELPLGPISVRPTCSISNAFNTRRATGYYTQQLLGSQAANAKPEPNYGLEHMWQSGRAFTAGVAFKF